MTKAKDTAGKNLTIGERREIEDLLREREPIGGIARRLGRSWSTIADEIKRHRVEQTKHYRVLEDRNICVHRRECRVTELCRIDCVGMRCSLCASTSCNRICPDFDPGTGCPKLAKAPFCCNGCRERLTISCGHKNLFYDADQAQEQADNAKVAGRTGIDCTEEELIEMVTLVKPLLRKGQSLQHIWQTHYPKDLKVSIRTFYRYIDAGVLDITNLDLPKKVKYKPRKKRSKDVPFRPNLAGHTYEDFTALTPETQMSAVEMDCVESSRGSEKAILTLYFRRICFQLMIMMPAHTAECVARALDWVEMLCGKDEFRRVLGLILTDRGHEFIDPALIETGIDGTKRCDVYYCDPLCRGQKGGCEKNHVELRKVLPKGTCFKNLTNAELSVICSHVNSYTRPSLGGLAPVDLALKMLPRDLLEGLAIERIEPDDVILRPSLLMELGLR